MSTAAADLPASVARVLDDFVRDARTALGDTLQSIVLFGSAAENRMRATSDVNVVTAPTSVRGPVLVHATHDGVTVDGTALGAGDEIRATAPGPYDVHASPSAGALIIEVR